MTHSILTAEGWRASRGTETFQAKNPKSGETLPDVYPVSVRADLEAMAAGAERAATELRKMPDAAARMADFLERYAAKIEAQAEEIAAVASAETAYPVSPRLKDVELPRTTGQLRQAAAAARDGSWARPTIDTKNNIRSMLAPIGPVLVIGPNNFPLAFNGISGGDFAAAIAAGNTVIAKAHPLHPTTSRLLGELAHQAAGEAGLPAGTVQMFYHAGADDGLKLVADRRVKAVAFTGSRATGLKLKATADGAGKPFFGELSSINPVVMLPGAIAEKEEELLTQYVTSVLMGTGQFCTNPGLLLMVGGAATEEFLSKTAAKLAATPAGTLLSEAGQKHLLGAIETIKTAGATLVTGGTAAGICAVQNTLFRTTAAAFLMNPTALQTEAFGNAALAVVADSVEQLKAVVETLEGNLTGCIYSHTGGADDAAYDLIAPALRLRVGRLLNDKMPTGVAVSPAMNHGGPFPATTNGHFTSVGIPASLPRFTVLESYDNVRPHRLPAALQNKNPTGKLWRWIDGNFTQADL